MGSRKAKVVICFHFSIFEPLETTDVAMDTIIEML